jgi:predicted AlkP superfamily phosphohydrolase/phosphomutase
MPREHIPFTVRRLRTSIQLEFPENHTVDVSTVTLQEGEWVRHIRLKYKLGEVAELHGTVSFKLLQGGHQVRLYATPVQFDPLEPNEIFAISSPMEFAPEIAERFGMYQTIGWAEATSALNDGNIDDQTFMETCQHSFDEKRGQILGLLKKPDDWDLLVAFTYELDRVCHMMWRHFDNRHPVHDPAAPAKFKHAIRDFYVKYDSLLGEVLDALPQNTTLIVLSDHGFAPFYRAVNLNRWLLENGYIVLKSKTGSPEMAGLMEGESSYFANYDWSKTRAFAMGLTKIYINETGRMPHGCVRPGQETESLKSELISGLKAIRDDGRPVISNVWRATDIWEGPRISEAPDLQIGFNWGFRTSWQTSLGGADEPIIADNLRNWSGDHCSFDPAIVPGVVFSNRVLNANRFRLVDVGMTVLRMMNVPLPKGRGSKDGQPWEILAR